MGNFDSSHFQLRFPQVNGPLGLSYTL